MRCLIARVGGDVYYFYVFFMYVILVETYLNSDRKNMYVLLVGAYLYSDILSIEKDIKKIKVDTE